VIVGAVVAVAGGLAGGLMIAQRAETGRWSPPQLERLPRMLDRIVAAEPARPRASKTIFLQRQPVTLTPGTDDAARGVSSVVAFHHPDGPVTMPGWKGGDKKWKQLTACVQKLFAPFDVVVTDQRPAHDDFVLVAVGGKPGNLARAAGHHTTGLAPFNGQVIPRPVVFAFSAQLQHAVRPICETIGMEVAHAYGLDHGYLCKDVMTYLSGCGAKSFVDQDVPCGEKSKRTCHGGKPTQNSYRWLVEVLGPRPPAEPPAAPAPAR
jgi:hypothetical protein